MAVELVVMGTAPTSEVGATTRSSSRSVTNMATALDANMAMRYDWRDLRVWLVMRRYVGNENKDLKLTVVSEPALI